MRRRLPAAAVALAALLLATPGAAAALIGAPDGYTVAARRVLTEGVEYAALVRPPASGAQRVHVARVSAGAPVTLRPVLSRSDIGGGKEGLERTSAMCLRVGCVAAVNADFYSEATGQPVGGMVRYGELVRSPNPKHHQLTLDASGSIAVGQLTWSGRLVPTDLSRIDLDGVNVDRSAERLVLYTKAFGGSTGTNRHGVELTGEIVRPAGPLRLGQTAVIRLTSLVEGGDTPIPSGGVVLSGHGKAARALGDLWRRAEQGDVGTEVMLRLEGEPDAEESVGGTPILVHDGRRWFAEESRDFFTRRHPRTAVGWNDEGDVWLVTVDGRQPGVSEGMTMRELAQLMIDLGAKHAINLDGGGSTTFASRGTVLNQPSDTMVERRGTREIVSQARRGDRVIAHVERPVANALAVVPIGDAAHGGTVPTLPADLGKVQTVPIPSRSGADPASIPDGALPAVVGPVASDRRIPLAALSLVANVVLVGVILVRRFRSDEA